MTIVNKVSVKETVSGTPTEVVYDLAPGNYYGTCTGQAANQNKAVSVSSDQLFVLKKGVLLAVKFDANNTYSATSSNPIKLNVNSTGNVQIYAYNTATSPGVNTTIYGEANYVNYYMYDGTYWVWAGHSCDNNTTYTPQKLGFGYGTCSTAASTAAKEATLTDYNLLTNGIVAVKFTNAVPANATLNVNSKGAKNIWYKGANIVANIIKAGDIATFIYDGTRYQLISIDSGNGLPDEVITYEQFSQKTDAEKEVYTGYISGWPGSGGGGGGGDTTIRYNEETDWIQVMFNNSWTNCYYAGMKLDPTKMELTQAEFIAICNQGLQSRMSVGAIIHVNNQYCNTLEVIGVEHENVLDSVDVMAHTQVGNMAFGSSQNYNTSPIRTWINENYINAFDYDVRELMKLQQVVTSGVTQNDKAKLLSWKELGLTTGYVDNTDGGTKYPVFTSGAYDAYILNRWRGPGNYGNSSYYWLRSKNTGGSNVWVAENSGSCTANAYTSNGGVLPVLRF